MIEECESVPAKRVQSGYRVWPARLDVTDSHPSIVIRSQLIYDSTSNILPQSHSSISHSRSMSHSFGLTPSKLVTFHAANPPGNEIILMNHNGVYLM